MNLGRIYPRWIQSLEAGLILYLKSNNMICPSDRCMALGKKIELGLFHISHEASTATQMSGEEVILENLTVSETNWMSKQTTVMLSGFPNKL